MVSYVNISELRVEDGGVYRCRADNGHASVEHQRAIQIRGAPVARRANNLTVLQGDTLSRSCPIAGYPLETPIWYKGKSTVDQLIHVQLVTYNLFAPTAPEPPFVKCVGSGQNMKKAATDRSLCSTFAQCCRSTFIDSERPI